MSGIKLVASEGKVLTNGETYGKIVFLGNADSPDNWYEITEEEKERREMEAEENGI